MGKVKTSRKALKSNDALLDHIKALPPSEELAHYIELAMSRTRKARLRKVGSSE
jgi:hypothetical protein